MTKTKILATIGPSSFDKIQAMINAGLDGIRMNMSHVRNYDEVAARVKQIRAINPDIFISADLQGPKIRLGDFNSLEVTVGEQVSIAYADPLHQATIPIQYDISPYVSRGDTLMIDDGDVILGVLSVENGVMNCEVKQGETINPRKGVNVPFVDIPLEYISAKDMQDLKFIRENDFDYVFASYARDRGDIIAVKEALRGTGIKVGGKPENHLGLQNLDEIVREADIMMVPRGDFGVELGAEKVPGFQRKLIGLCNILGKPVITATQMLESMTNSLTPRRSETTDVYNAAMSGTDMVMLSGETSIGKYPVETVRMMNRILDEADKDMFDNRGMSELSEKIYSKAEVQCARDIVCQSVYSMAQNNNISAIVIPTNSGRTAELISRFRFQKPIYAVTYNDRVRRQLGGVWGVTALKGERLEGEVIVGDAIRRVKENGYIKNGDLVVVTAGLGDKAQTSVLRLEEVR